MLEKLTELKVISDDPPHAVLSPAAANAEDKGNKGTP
jgi:hypothetical protein